MSQRPDGKPVGVERVVFTRPAAERISNAVRKVEAGNRDGQPLVFRRVSAAAGSQLRLGTFTGDWQTGTYKTVTLTGSTQTASVYNWTTPVVVNTGSTECRRYVIFGNAAGTHSLVEVQLQHTSCTCVLSVGGIDLTQLQGYSASQVQLLGHNTTGPCLQWYSVSTCTTSTAA